MGPGASPFVATKLKEGLKQWLVLGNRISCWEGPIPHLSDAVRSLKFETYLNHIAIGWDQVFKGKVSKLWVVATVGS